MIKQVQSKNNEKTSSWQTK